MRFIRELTMQIFHFVFIIYINSKVVLAASVGFIVAHIEKFSFPDANDVPFIVYFLKKPQSETLQLTTFDHATAI
jgi:hypothetical protein